MSEGDAEEELLEAFKVLDPEGFGYVNSAELRNVLTSLGEKLTDDDLDEMIKEGENFVLFLASSQFFSIMLSPVWFMFLLLRTSTSTSSRLAMFMQISKSFQVTRMMMDG